MRTGPQSLSQQQKGPTPAQMKLNRDMNEEEAEELKRRLKE